MMLERLRTHPCRKRNLEDLFQSLRLPGKQYRQDPVYRKLSDRLMKLTRRGRLRMVGTVQLREYGGRPENVYFTRRVKIDWLEHEARLTDFFQSLGWPECVRGGDVERINGVRPDAVWKGARERIVEMDCDTEKRDEIEKKANAYRDYPGAVLFITINDRRRRQLLEWSEAIDKTVHAAVLSEIVTDPTGKVWMDRGGVLKAIPN